jgi:excisionase family DNA binding protein
LVHPFESGEGSFLHFITTENGHPAQRINIKMEKFCIVKRRKQGFPNPFPLPLLNWEDDLGFGDNAFKPLETLNSREGSVLSLSLTQGQSQAIRYGGILPLLGTETDKTLNLKLDQQQDGSVVFNFHIDPDHNLMMLKPDQVCRMMQISRHLLNRLVKENKINSHKIGRLRRFCLKDIVEALRQSLA